MLTAELEQLSAALGLPMAAVYLVILLSGLLIAIYALHEMATALRKARNVIPDPARGAGGPAGCRCAYRLCHRGGHPGHHVARFDPGPALTTMAQRMAGESTVLRCWLSPSSSSPAT